jgi:hypothetical protein
LARRYAELEQVLSGLLPEGAPALAAARRLAGGDAGRAFDGRRPRPSPAADVLEIELPFLVEAESRLVLDESGAIALDDHGFPDRGSYFAASKAAALLREPEAAALVPEADRPALERLKAAYDRTRALLFSDHNEALSARYAEPTPGGKALTLLDLVRSERFKTPKWWVWSSQHNGEAPRGYAHVTGERALSPFLKELGPGAFTTIYWPALPDGGLGVPDAEGLRLRVNSDAAGNELMLEMMAPIGREDDGSVRWRGFFFKKIGDEWVPGSRLKVEPSRRCIACHYRIDSSGRKRPAPLPVQLRSKESLMAVGYEDTALIGRYLRLLESPR